MNDLERFLGAQDGSGIDQAILADSGTAHMMVSGHQLLSQRQIPGLELASESTADGIRIAVRVLPNVRLDQPLHLCFGVLHATGRQFVETRLTLEEGAALRVVAHCFFQNAEQVEHRMDAAIAIGPRGQLRYDESHYHGPHGGVVVQPRANVKVGKGGLYQSDFSLTHGRVGKLDIDYEVEAAEQAVVELTARVFGHRVDGIKIRERLVLAGRGARGLIKTRVAVEDDATAEIIGITEGNSEGARGHVDCLEIVKDRAVASALPVVKVSHPQAKVTHEAAIGSVDHHQLETLMAHGLSPEEAVDLIVGGLLGRREEKGLSVISFYPPDQAR
jgi:Fe-S cluster assembly scaffold protein SufB